MDKAFGVNIMYYDTLDCDACSTVVLPAMPYEIIDALERANFRKDADMSFDVDKLYMHPVLKGALMHKMLIEDIWEANALAWEVARLSEQEAEDLAAYVELDCERNGGNLLPVSRVYDLLRNVHCICCMAKLRSDTELGRLCVENEMLPELDELPEEIIQLMSFEKLGRRFREVEDGRYIQGGYYVLDETDFKEEFKTLKIFKTPPDYTVLLWGVSRGNKVDFLPLPAEDYDVDRFMEKVESEAAEIVCADVLLPKLREELSTFPLDEVRAVSEELAELEKEDVLNLKALMKLKRLETVAEARKEMKTIGEYKLYEGLVTERDLGKRLIESLMGKKLAGVLLPCVDLNRFGKSIDLGEASAFTDYGLLHRIDDEPILSPVDREIKEAKMGMEMIL